MKSNDMMLLALGVGAFFLFSQANKLVQDASYAITKAPIEGYNQVKEQVASDVQKTINSFQSDLGIGTTYHFDTSQLGYRPSPYTGNWQVWDVNPQKWTATTPYKTTTPTQILYNIDKLTNGNYQTYQEGTGLYAVL